MTLLVITVSLTLSVSFLCSLLEAALLSVPIASLAERRQEVQEKLVAAYQELNQLRV